MDYDSDDLVIRKANVSTIVDGLGMHDSYVPAVFVKDTPAPQDTLVPRRPANNPIGPNAPDIPRNPKAKTEKPDTPEAAETGGGGGAVEAVETPEAGGGSGAGEAGEESGAGGEAGGEAGDSAALAAALDKAEADLTEAEAKAADAEAALAKANAGLTRAEEKLAASEAAKAEVAKSADAAKAEVEKLNTVLEKLQSDFEDAEVAHNAQIADLETKLEDARVLIDKISRPLPEVGETERTGYATERSNALIQIVSILRSNGVKIEDVTPINNVVDLYYSDEPPEGLAIPKYHETDFVFPEGGVKINQEDWAKYIDLFLKIDINKRNNIMSNNEIEQFSQDAEAPIKLAFQNVFTSGVMSAIGNDPLNLQTWMKYAAKDDGQIFKNKTFTKLFTEKGVIKPPKSSSSTEVSGTTTFINWL